MNPYPERRAAMVVQEETRHGRAIAQYRKALELEPGFTMARFNLAAAYVQIRSYKDAIQEFETALKASPSDAGRCANWRMSAATWTANATKPSSTI